MKLRAALTLTCQAALGVLGATPSVAHAETTLDEHDGTTGRRPSSQLAEASCDLDVDLRGAVALVELRQRIVNPGPGPMAATYELDLPAGATLTGFALRGDGPGAEAIPISGPFTNADVRRQATGVLGADPALVVALPPDASAQYAVRLQPIAPDHDVVMITRYTMLAELRGGALHVVLPGRANAGKLTACRGQVRAAAGPGATIRGIRVGADRTGRASATFALDAQDVAIDAELAFAGRTPVVWTQTQRLIDDWSATLVTVAAPAATATLSTPHRVLFVIDGSRSMELVGRHNVAKVISTLTSAFPAGTELDAILYDREPKRLFEAWRPGDAKAVGELVAAVMARPAQNGSDLIKAFELAHTLVADGSRGQTKVIVISDGVLGEVDGPRLARALDGKTSSVDLLAIVLDPAHTPPPPLGGSPGAAALHSPVNLYGGAFVELGVAQLDASLGIVDEWLRPSWLELSLGKLDIPSSVRAGSGFTKLVVHQGAAPRLVLAGHGPSALAVAARAAAAAPVATLALAEYGPNAIAFSAAEAPSDPELARAARLRARAVAQHPYVREDLSLAVLTTQGRVAGNRLAMVKGGGPYERITAVDDPTDRPGATASSAAGATAAAPSAIAKITLERLFRDQLQPRAYACYQRALGTNPKLAGTARFELHLGRGEITHATLSGLGAPQLDACLLDAAYSLQIPLPDFTINADDQTIAHYPLTFAVAEAKAVIVPGDADSSSPLDIDGIEGGVPATAGKRSPLKPNTATPLGNLRPTAQP